MDLWDVQVCTDVSAKKIECMAELLGLNIVPKSSLQRTESILSYMYSKRLAAQHFTTGPVRTVKHIWVLFSHMYGLIVVLLCIMRCFCKNFFVSCHNLGHASLIFKYMLSCRD